MAVAGGEWGKKKVSEDRENDACEIQSMGNIIKIYSYKIFIMPRYMIECRISTITVKNQFVAMQF